VRSMIDLLRRTLGEAIAIETRLADGLSEIMVDPGQIENTLLNLSVNARDAMPRGGNLVIETAKIEIGPDRAEAFPEFAPGRYVALSVTDTGEGMTPEVMRRAFEPFFTTKGPGAGTGLGLSMVYGFAKQSGGHVQLYSEVGHGTTVRVYLPARDSQAVAASGASPEARRHAKSGETILVVEDDARVRRISVRRLRELGYAVIEAATGPDALAVIETGKPFDLMFTDVVMAGGMTGFELAEAARGQRPDLKILFTSGFAEPAVARSEAMIANSGWLGKPYATGDLQAKIRELLDR